MSSRIACLGLTDAELCEALALLEAAELEAALLCAVDEDAAVLVGTLTEEALSGKDGGSPAAPLVPGRTPRARFLTTISIGRSSLVTFASTF